MQSLRGSGSHLKYFSKQPYASFEQAFAERDRIPERSFQVVQLPNEETEPEAWGGLHMGAERVVNCEHMQALLANIMQKRSEWQKDRRGPTWSQSSSGTERLSWHAWT